MLACSEPRGLPGTSIDRAAFQQRAQRAGDRHCPCFTIGSLSSPVIKSVVDQALSDPIFTGRTEIWQLAIDWFWKRPLFGFGYGAYQVMYFTSLNEDGAPLADHAHNAVLNLAVTTGVPGVLLALVWAVVLPCGDVARCLRARADVATTNLFLRIRAFAIANCAFESILFGRGDPMWFTMLMAMFGLRFLSDCRLGDHSGPSFAE